MSCGLRKVRSVVNWPPPPFGALKFNVDGAAIRKSGPAGIGGVLCYHKGEVTLMFSKNAGSKESNEAEIMAVLEALCIFSAFFPTKLIVESDSENAVRWVSHHGTNPWRFQFLSNEIKELSSPMEVVFG